MTLFVNDQMCISNVAMFYLVVDHRQKAQVLGIKPPPLY